MDRGIVYRSRAMASRPRTKPCVVRRVLHDGATASLVSIFENFTSGDSFFIYTYDGEIDVAGVQEEPTPTGDVKLSGELGLRCEAVCCRRCRDGEGVEP